MQGTAHGSFRAPFKAQGRASPAAPCPASLVPPLPKPTRQEVPVVGDEERIKPRAPLERCGCSALVTHHRIFLLLEKWLHFAQ